MRKTFVLDTSVLAYDPYSFRSFAGNNVVIAITVLDELDKIKKFSSEGGKNARIAIRALDKISNLGEIHNGIQIENDIIIKIDTSAYGSLGSDPTYGDSKILACAFKIQEADKDNKVILVSKDINLRTRARAFGLIAEDYNKDKVKSSDLYEGFCTVENQDAGIALFAAGTILIANYQELNDLYPNECVLFLGKDGKGIAAGRRIKDQIKLIKDKTPWGLELRNKEQLFATELLLDHNIHLVSIVGLAGSGKTLCAIACALELVINQKAYDNLTIYRPMHAVGAEVGFLPGSIDEKLAPWFGPINDAFSFLCSDRSRRKDGWRGQFHQYLDNETIKMEALTYIRGRSLNNSLVLVDEAQNLTKDEMKTILTRIGIGSKIILTGDISQIDNAILDSSNNGLTCIVEAFKEYDITGHIAFSKGERSVLATLASQIM